MTEPHDISLSSDAIGLQMKIMNALVTGARIADTLPLVLQAVQLRFPDSAIGIWTMPGPHPSDAPLTLVAHRGWSHIRSLAMINPGPAVPAKLWVRSHAELAKTWPSLQWFAINNTKGHLVGWMGLKHPQPLSPKEAFLIDPYIKVAGLIIEKAWLDEEIYFLAYHDYLTEVPNRRLFHQRLDSGLAEAIESHRPLSLVLLDVDRFKAFNDTYGHHRGDEVLQMVARRLNDALDSAETVARMGGDEFSLILPDVDGHDAFSRIQALMIRLGHPLPEDHAITIEMSAGIATCPTHGTTSEALLHCADAALYQAKKIPQYGVILYGD